MQALTLKPLTFRRSAPALGALLALAFLARPAQSATFLYTFNISTASLQAGIDSADVSHLEHAYYNFFFQPVDAFVTVTGETAPSAELSVGDYSVSFPTFGANPWVGFTKTSTQTNIAVVSDANGGTGGADIFLNKTYTPSSANADPPGWGNSGGITGATIDTVLAGNTIFQITVSSTQAIATELFNVKAVGIESTSTSSYAPDPSKQVLTSITNFSASATPEPSTFAPCIAGLLFLVGGYKKLRSKRAN